MEYNDGLGVLLLLQIQSLYAVLFISSMINVHSAINADTARWESGDRHVNLSLYWHPSCLYQPPMVQGAGSGQND